MFSWLKKLFSKKSKEEPKRRQITADQVDDPSPLLREGVARAFNTGKPISGWIDDDGNMHFKELD